MSTDTPDVPGTPITVETTPERALTGATIGAGMRVVCFGCGGHFGEGREVRVYAHRMSDEAALHPTRATCADCANGGTIEHPTLGACEVLADVTTVTQSDAATQRHCLAIGDATVLDHSPPDQGTGP